MIGSSKERGNVLFLILIAVALFAALSYAITQSSRGGSSGVDEDKVKMDVAVFLQYLATIDTQFMRMRISNGCADTDINFDNDHYIDNTGGIAMPTGSHKYAPADGSCDFFHANGGNLHFYELPQAYIVSGHTGTWRSGNMYMVDAPMMDMGTAADDLIITLGHVTPEFCLALNEATGYGSSIPTASIGAGNGDDYFDGDYDGPAVQINIAHNTFCASWTGNPTHDSVWHLLHAN